MGMRPQIELHIEELVLEGFSPGDRYRIGNSLERELIRLLEDYEISESLSSKVNIDRIDAGVIEVNTRLGGRDLGTKLGRAIYKVIMSDSDGSKNFI